MRALRICFWSTSFQADNQALATYLAADDGFEVVVAMDDPQGYAAAPVNRILPFAGRWLDSGIQQRRPRLRDSIPMCS